KNEPGPSMKAVVISGDSAIGGPSGFAEGGTHASSRLMHRENFIKAVRSRNVLDLTADILEGHLSSSLCHLANISYRLGRELRFDDHSERFIGDDQANGYLTREYRYPYIVPENV
ncbi:MAG: hypothetical protein U9P14_06215, partial [Gemmatimonadota bacterium]|nr:hypothetical protein [Gemmatimonadota bacterium]